MGLIKSPFSIVCDAGPIIHLDELNCLDLVFDFNKVFIPEAVLQEIKRHRPQVLKNDLFNYENIKVGSIHNMELKTLVTSLSLHEGEQEALNLMLSKPESMLITDDSAARLAATTLKLKVHGTIGIIIRAIRRNQRSTSEVIEIVHSIPSKSSLHIKPAMLNSVLGQLKNNLI